MPDSGIGILQSLIVKLNLDFAAFLHFGISHLHISREAAEHCDGFVPVSPDGVAYRYDRRRDEVRNARHGSLTRPKTHKSLAENAPIRQLLEQLQSMRADLRFREDGIHTTLTVDRQVKGKLCFG